MLYLFILGREPLLSLAEINSVLKKEKINFSLKAWATPFCVIESESILDVPFLMQELGGTIKISLVFNQIETTPEMSSEKLAEAIKEKTLPLLKEKGAGNKKVFFGLSFYNHRTIKKNPSKFLKNLGLEIKNTLEKNGIKSRLVTSNEDNLSSVTVKMNKLLSPRGAEIILADDEKNIWLAETKAVQPFDKFSERDFGRPGRDVFSGMLPPKLAKIMINLAETIKTAKLLDPFCGSGTILTEAGLMNYKNLFGSDNSPKAITDTEKNLAWGGGRAEIKVCDAQKLSECFQQKFEAIITEPFLGPPLRGGENKDQLLQTRKQLTDLYSSSLKEFHKILTDGGTVVMIWPIIGEVNLPLKEKLKGIGWQIIPLLEKTAFTEEQKTISYFRPEQKVKREIV